MSCEQSREIDFAAFLLEREDPRYAEFRAHYPGCPDCAEQVAQFTRLEHELGHSAPSAAGAHPAEETLLAYAEAPATLDFDLRRSLETHLEACAPCRTELSVLERFDFEAIGVMPTEPARGSLWQNWSEGLSAALGQLGGWVTQPAFAAAALAVVLLPVGWVWLQGGPERPTGATPGFAARPVIEEPLPGVLETELGLPEATSLAEAVPPAALPEAVEPVVPEVVEPALQLAAENRPEAVVEGPSREVAPAVEPEMDSLIAGPEVTLLAANFPSNPIRYGVDQIELLGGASVRTAGQVRAATPGTGLAIQTLAPEHVGWTSGPSPTLYFWLSEPTTLPIEVTVADDVSIEPLVEFTSGGPRAAGLHAVSLAQLGAQLEPGVIYRWQISAIPDAERRSRDVRAGAAIVWQVPDAETSRRWEEAGAGERAHRLAEQGYWYDAFAQLSEWMDAREPAQGVQEARASLLEQVDLEVPLDEGGN